MNLLLNRPSSNADVQSHIPYVGQVDVKIKKPLDLSIRIPEWVKPSQIRVQVNHTDRKADWDGRYAVVGEVKPGDTATMIFPIAQRTETVWIEKDRFTLVRKGNDVVANDPPGRICPLYQREHYRANSTRCRKARRFVSPEEINWRVASPEVGAVPVERSPALAGRAVDTVPFWSTLWSGCRRRQSYRVAGSEIPSDSGLPPETRASSAGAPCPSGFRPCEVLAGPLSKH